MIIKKVDVGFDGKFDKDYDFCLVTPYDNKLDLVYFNVGEEKVIELKESVGEVKIDKAKSILFCLTKRAELMVPKNFGCQIGINRPEGLAKDE